MEEEEENLIVKGMVVKLCCLFEIKCYIRILINMYLII